MMIGNQNFDWNKMWDIRNIIWSIHIGKLHGLHSLPTRGNPMVFTMASTTVHSALNCHPVSFPLPPPNMPFALIACSCFVVNRSETKRDKGNMRKRRKKIKGRKRWMKIKGKYGTVDWLTRWLTHQQYHLITLTRTLTQAHHNQHTDVPLTTVCPSTPLINTGIGITPSASRMRIMSAMYPNSRKWEKVHRFVTIRSGYHVIELNR